MSVAMTKLESELESLKAAPCDRSAPQRRAMGDILIEFGCREETRCQARNPVAGSYEGPGWRLTEWQAEASCVAALAKIESDRWQAWTVGEIYGYDGTEGHTAACTGTFLNDWQQGHEHPEHLAGRFVIFCWSGDDRRWHVWTDRVGSIHAYHTESECGNALGTYSPAVYAFSRRRLDWAGLAAFFSTGFFPGERTHYDDVRVLRPASRYEFDEQGRLVGRESYWKWRHEPDNRRSEADTIAEFGETLREVLAQQTRGGRVVLPLSGGLDSRTVAACLPEEHRVRAYAYGYTDDSVETGIAAQVARAQGLEFTRHTIRPYLFEQLDKVMWAVEGFQDVTQARQADVSDWLRGNADYVLAAHWGDVLCDSTGLSGNSKNSLGAVLQHALGKLQKRGRDWLLINICQPSLNGQSPDQIIREIVRSELAAFDGIADPDFRVKALKTTQWAFRWTLPSLRMYQVAAFPRTPFLDPRMIDFFCTLPSWMVHGRRLQIEFLKRFAPELARVRWQVYDADLFNYQHFNTWLLPRRAWKKARRILSRRPVIQRNWEVQFFAPGQWERLADWLLRPGLRLHDFVGAGRIRELLDRFHASPSAADGYTVSMLLTFSAWLEMVGNK